MGGRIKYPYMVLQRGIWHARMEIPPHLRESLGQRLYSQTTRRSDPDDAYALAQPWIAAWKRKIETARQSAGIEAAKHLSTKFLESVGLEADYLLLSDMARFVARRQYGLTEFDWRTNVAKHGYDVTAALKAISKDAPKALAAITGESTLLVTPELLEAFRTENLAGLTPKSLYEYVRTLERFSVATPDLTAEEFGTQHIQDFIRERMAGPTGVKVVTIKKDVAAIQTYWQWLVSRNNRLKSIKPFDGIVWPQRRRERRDPTAPGYKLDPNDLGPRFQPAQVCDLWDAADQRRNKDLRDLIVLCAYTGGRREGVFALHRNAIDLDAAIPHLTLDEKTEAGQRVLAIHPAIVPLIKARIRQSRDGYLFRPSKGKIGIASSRMTNPMRRLLDETGFGARANA